jgi:uncharacterized protein YpuA (DUF1002 family)
MKTRFPLIYRAIDSTARLNEYVMRENFIDSTIMTQCRSFLTIGFMISNPERLCNVNSETFNVFYLRAITENHQGNIMDCYNKNTFDARNACLNLDWKKVLDSLVKQIGDYHLKVLRRTYNT